MIYERRFVMAYYLGVDLQEVKKMPIKEINWYIKRLNKEFEKGNSDSKAAHYNTPDVRAMNGKSRAHVPKKLIRPNGTY
jgi:hypothetical protein